MTRPAISRRFVTTAVAVIAGAGLGVGGLSACSSGGGGATGAVPAAATAPAPAPNTSSSVPSSPAPATGPVTAAQASAIAAQASPGSVVEVDQDVEATGPVFEVTVGNPDGSRTKVQVDANTGQVLGSETDSPDHQPGDGH